MSGIKLPKPLRYAFDDHTLIKRIFGKCIYTGNCIVWQESTNADGYPQLRVNGKLYYATRLVLYSYDLEFDLFNPAIKACHTCPSGDNPSCCNPFHLHRGTNAENMREAARLGRYSSHSISDILEIREKYATGKFTQEQLGLMYSYGHDEISRIVNHKRWLHI